jgi:hypothetical protein
MWQKKINFNFFFCATWKNVQICVFCSLFVLGLIASTMQFNSNINTSDYNVKCEPFDLLHFVIYVYFWLHFICNLEQGNLF